MGSFCCLVPGHPLVQSASFTQVSANRWVVDLTSATPINEIVAFITQPLAADQALACYVASAPFEQAQWHYLGPISNDAPSVSFKTRYVWSARDAVPTHVQFGVELRNVGELAATPAEKVSAEVLEAARRIGQDLYDFAASFDILPAELLNKWLTRFNDKCRRDGLDWLNSLG